MVNKECCRCHFFEAYYTKAYCCFLRSDCGRCFKTKETVKKHSTCDKWKTKVYYRETSTFEIVGGINQAITDLNEIRNFLEDNKK
ncbi:MAG: hypothetical protein K2K80_00715 [Clostridia bacterium]|nr:hypothetical protein [Clostridia bacterium]